MPNAYAYIRVSTDKQQNSLGSQADLDIKRAEFLGLELPESRHFVDEARSGSIPLRRRPAGKRLMETIQAGDTLIVTAIDRIARNLRDLLHIFDDLVERGVNVHVINFGGASLDMKSAVGRLLIQILGAIAEFERNMVIERTVAAIAFRRQQGQPVSKYMPPGQEKSTYQAPNGETLYIYSQKEWDLMAEVYRRHDLLGESWYAIGKDFLQRGITTNNGGPWVKISPNPRHGSNLRPMQMRYRIYKEWLERNEGRPLECSKGMVFVPVAGPTKPTDAPRVTRRKTNGERPSLLPSGSSSSVPSVS